MQGEAAVYAHLGILRRCVDAHAAGAQQQTEHRHSDRPGGEQGQRQRAQLRAARRPGGALQRPEGDRLDGGVGILVDGQGGLRGGVQMVSVQAMCTAGGGAPGRTLKLIRTSR
ncbi:MAG: hypothetical protein AMXMBFR26_06460 [Porticoccaceae bacterium]